MTSSLDRALLESFSLKEITRAKSVGNRENAYSYVLIAVNRRLIKTLEDFQSLAVVLKSEA